MAQSKTLVVNPPLFRKVRPDSTAPSVFLAGSIEMGKAMDWQAEAITRLDGYASLIYNPRRPDWDSSWEQDINHPEFNVQVNWELDHIEISDIVVMYFDPNTQSPITLLELGFLSAAAPHKTLVCCPDKFWRKGNVDIMCERYGIHTFGSLEEMLDRAQEWEQRYSALV